MGLLLALLLLGVDVFAQKVIVRKRSVNGQVQTEETMTEAPTDSRHENWALKFNVTSMAIGEFGLSVEYLVNDWLTIEGGAGLLTKNYLSEAFFDNPFGFNDVFGDAIYCESCEYEYENAVSTFLRVKFFPDEDALDEGGYFALTYSNRPYGGMASVQDGLGSIPWKSNSNDFGAVFGRQYDLGTHMMMEYFLGAGIRFSDVIAPYAIYDFPYNHISSSQEEETSGYLVAGFQLGYLF